MKYRSDNGKEIVLFHAGEVDHFESFFHNLKPFSIREVLYDRNVSLGRQEKQVSWSWLKGMDDRYDFKMAAVFQDSLNENESTTRHYNILKSHPNAYAEPNHDLGTILLTCSHLRTFKNSCYLYKKKHTPKNNIL